MKINENLTKTILTRGWKYETVLLISKYTFLMSLGHKTCFHRPVFLKGGWKKSRPLTVIQAKASLQQREICSAFSPSADSTWVGNCLAVYSTITLFSLSHTYFKHHSRKDKDLGLTAAKAEPKGWPSGNYLLRSSMKQHLLFWRKGNLGNRENERRCFHSDIRARDLAQWWHACLENTRSWVWSSVL